MAHQNGGVTNYLLAGMILQVGRVGHEFLIWDLSRIEGLLQQKNW